MGARHPEDSCLDGSLQKEKRHENHSSSPLETSLTRKHHHAPSRRRLGRRIIRPFNDRSSIKALADFCASNQSPNLNQADRGYSNWSIRPSLDCCIARVSCDLRLNRRVGDNPHNSAVVKYPVLNFNKNTSLGFHHFAAQSAPVITIHQQTEGRLHHACT